MKDKEQKLDVIENQLMDKESFLRFCSFDYHSRDKLEIADGFIVAAEKDGLIKPLIKRGKAKFYSSHQIFIVAALASNEVNNGLLWAKGEYEKFEEYYKGQGFRVINWGCNGYAFNIVAAENGRGTGIKGYNHLDVCREFHKILLLLHSLPQKDYFDPKNIGILTRLQNIQSLLLLQHRVFKPK